MSNQLNILEYDRTESNKYPNKTFITFNDLKPINNLKQILREIRDYFAGNVTGITRDEIIAQNILRLLFCKIYDERNVKSVDYVEFSTRANESLPGFSRRIHSLFENVKNRFPDIFESKEKIELMPRDLFYIVSKLEKYSLINAERDVVADAFEELIGTSFRGGEGQFFTPRNVVQMMIDVLKPGDGESILDPACGSGGFLAYSLRYLLSKNKKKYNLVGIDKDAFLAKIAKIYLTLIGDKEYQVLCENSLDLPGNWEKKTQGAIRLNSYDLILTNPPFGAKIPVIGRELLGQYQLGRKWEIKDGKESITKQLLLKQPPQILFIERCIQLLKEGGRLGIVLPEGIFGNPSDKYIWEYISQNAHILGVVSLSQETFQPSTHTKTSVLFLKKGIQKPKRIFMAIANTVGHNKNGKVIYKINKDGSFLYDKHGNQILDDDLPLISTSFSRHLNGGQKKENHLGFSIDYKHLKDHIYIPEYYNPEIRRDLETLNKSGKYHLTTIGELACKGIIKIKRGNEIGSQYYGTGEVPFIRTSDIVNWEIKVDPVKCVAEEIYDQYKRQQDIRENDILFVNDGTFLIGRTAMITKHDLKSIIQSHVRKIRVLNMDYLDPFYLLYLLNSKIVRRQIDSKTFVQATISTIGSRLNEVILPISKNKKDRQRIAKEIRDIIQQKTLLRQRSIKAIEESI
jgi:type I restriction enzyme M protein